MKKCQWLFVAFLILLPPSLEAQDFPVEFSNGWTIPLEGRYGRDAIVRDQLLYRMINKSLEYPTPSDSIGWNRVEVRNNGWFQNRDLRGGYLYTNYKSSKNQIAILEANGHQEAFVNGSPRGGDVYAYGWVQHPVKLKRGQNALLFHVPRGRVKVALTEPDYPVFLSDRDILIPDYINGRNEPVYGAIRVINATEKELSSWRLTCVSEDGSEQTVEVPLISPLSSRKVGFILPDLSGEAGEKVQVKFYLFDHKNRIQGNPDGLTMEVPVKAETDKHKETFVSEIDGSIQYYSVVPSTNTIDTKQALFLSLHGASVEAVNQANAYQHKDWGTLVAATNRRPYGFDWEDWGRMDAIEVLNIARERYQPDENRLYLTGHSMGGHGTWQVGVTYPDLWAAIAPSAGWYSFWSYGGKRNPENPDPVQDMLKSSSNPSHTLGLKRNFKQYGIYVLHGDADDNVPVSQARFMREQLGAFHPDFTYYERPGAGHWWGNECVDWPPLFDYFKIHRKLPAEELKSFEFITASPGISARSHFIWIWQQLVDTEFSSINVVQNVNDSQLTISTENCRILKLSTAHLSPGKEIQCQLDSSDLVINTGSDPHWFINNKGSWTPVDQVNLSQKNPHRYGGFKNAFTNQMVFVYGTKGTSDEDKDLFDKARFDAETFWYRGNGSVEVIADHEFDPADYPSSNVILYGNQEQNSQYGALLAECPVQVEKGRISVGDKLYHGSNLGIYFTYPRSGSDKLSVAVIASSGPEGTGAIVPNRYFTSGSGFPDLMLFTSDMLKEGSAGVKLTGYFGYDWSVEKGQWAENE